MELIPNRSESLWQNLISLFALLILILCTQQVAYADAVDSVSQNFAAAESPGIKSCTTGYSQLSGDVTYGKQIISGALPYGIQYRAHVRTNSSASRDYYNSLSTFANWSDNYTNYIASSSSSYFIGNESVPSTVYTIKLPGDDQKYYFRILPDNIKVLPDGVTYANTSTLYRIGLATDASSSSIARQRGENRGPNGYREMDLQLSTGSITVTRYGVVYTATAAIASGSGTVFRITNIQYPNGHKLTLSYDSNLNLTSVSDNRNNVLTLTHAQQNFPINGTTPAMPLQQPVSSVKYTSGQLGDSQQTDFTYAPADTYTSGHQLVRNYILTQITNARTSQKESYSYTNTLSLGTYSSAVYSTAPVTDFYIPVLHTVVNGLNQVAQTWNVTHPSYTYDKTSRTFTDAQTTIESYLGDPSGPSAMDMTTKYNDNSATSSTITTTFSPDGSQNATSTINVSYPDIYHMSLSVSGYPCLFSGGKPISAAYFDSPDGLILSTTDGNNVQTSYGYDIYSRLAQTIQAAGTNFSRTTTYTYGNLNTNIFNPYTTPTVIQGPYQTVTNSLNSRGQVVQQVKTYTQAGSVASQTWSYDYFEDASQPSYGLLGHVVNPRGTAADDQIWYGYDNYGNLIAKSQHVSGVSRDTHYNNPNSAGLPTSINYPDGNTSMITYDSGYRILRKSFGNAATAQVVSNTYDSLGRLATSTDADGKTTSYSYDSVGRLSSNVFPNGNQEKYSYFPNNTINTSQQASSNGTMFAMTQNRLDSAGRIYTVLQGSLGDRNWKAFVYDGNGNVIETWTSLNIHEHWAYDLFNNVTSHTDGNGNVDTKGFDNVNNNITENAANSAGSTRYFKNQNVLAVEQNPDFGEKDHYHDLDNNEVEQHHGDRQCKFGTIDQIGRSPLTSCTSISVPDVKLLVNDAYSYDQSAYGNLDSVTSQTAYGVNTTYSYDIFHRITSKAQHNNTPPTWGYPNSTLTTSYAYTNAGKLNSLTTPAGNVVSYNYNANSGMLDNIQLNNTYVIKNIGYDGASRLSYFYWGKGGTWQQWLDDAGEVSQISSTLAGSQISLKLNYGFDLDGRITSQSIAGASTTTYSYDNNSQLQSESTNDGRSLTYTYDQNGNRKSLRSTGNWGLSYASQDYQYTANHMNSWTKNGGAQAFGYTPTGELVSSYTGTSAYDHAGRRRSESGVPGSTKYIGMYMDYNHKNERTFRGGSYIDRQYAYDESSHLIGEYNSAGAMIVEYIWMGDKPIAAVYPGGRIVYIVTDHQNKPRRGIDAATQQVVWAWDPDAFGAVKPIESGAQINLRFPGQYYDEATGLYYNHNRYYNPELGRYMEPDPTGLDSGLNPYAYAGNNPVNSVDPTGLYEDGGRHWLGEDLNTQVYSMNPDSYHGSLNINNTCWSGFTGSNNGVVDSYSPYGSESIEAVYPEFWVAGFGGVARDMAFSVIDGIETVTFTASKEFNFSGFSNIFSRGGYSVYQGLDAEGIIRYIGITGRNPSVRFAEHADSIGTGKEFLRYEIIDGAEGLSRSAARVQEQNLINLYGLQRNGGLLLNRINSISPTKWDIMGVVP
ncbi:RHS repeat-associated core domain-containing protein [Aquirhabdus sp.]|uniref:RHS repeat-associated core domain-containing protein n=1 Tax=Aquirhabdus sp. TaxID=2824160 RepID=UPI00396CDEB6